MVHRCCISSCGMSVRVLEAKGLSYHKFPTKETIRDQWVQAIIPHMDKPESFKVVPRYTRVCSRHFRKKDYCIDAKKRARLTSSKRVYYFYFCITCCITDLKNMYNDVAVNRVTTVI